MLSPFFSLAALSPTRQRSFRKTVVAHLGVLLGCVWWACRWPESAAATLGYVLLTAGIVEGAALLGWRLTQLPKSQCLEFLLATPLRPQRVFLAEALVGFSLLVLVTLSGLPVLIVFAIHGHIEWLDLLPILIMPPTWGTLTGLGLITWAYEPSNVRRWAERILLFLTVIYLGVGVLAGEHLTEWIHWLPGDAARLVLNSIEALHRYNPFALVHFWVQQEFIVAWDRALGLEVAAVVVTGLLLLRAATRLHGHFHEQHYRPLDNTSRQPRGLPGDRPLSWWAVRRVMQYSGRVNLWLAGGFGILYALYTVAGSHWPSWLGQRIFVMFDEAGGIPLWAAALVVLAAVPAAFQYGLWDSSKQERCRRMELLLLTQLTARDYWHAAATAAWLRGRGYFLVALLLWAAAIVAGTMRLSEGIAGPATGILLWSLYFALGFRAFSRGSRANHLGIGLTVGLPGLAFLLSQLGWPALAALLPPGNVFYSAGSFWTVAWLPGAMLSALAALVVARRALANCETEMRSWYGTHQGRIVAE